MVNFKESLTKLHSEFPEFELEKLFKIMECIVEEVQLNISNSGTIEFTKYPWESNITCNKTNK